MLNIEINGKYKKIAFTIGILFIFFIAFYYLSEIFIMFGISYIIAYMFEPLIKYLQKKGFKRGLSVILIWIILVAMMFLFVFPVILSIVSEISILVPKIAEYSQDFGAHFEKIKQNYQKNRDSIFVSRVFEFLGFMEISEKNIIDFGIEQGRKFLTLSGNAIKNNINNLISSFVWIFTIPVITFYTMLDFKEIAETIKAVEFPSKRKVRKIFIEIEREISKFFRGQLLICVIVGILMGFGFFFIGIDFPHLLGVIAGFANIIPYLGVLISTSVAIFFAVLKFGFTMELVFILIQLGIIVILVQSLDGFLLSPKILGETLNVSPVFVMLFLMAGGMVSGILGMFFAVPVLLVLRVLYNNISIKLS
ncbi:MAG: AI-2E family transporter [Candidatus Muiribacteriota bacterium]